MTEHKPRILLVEDDSNLGELLNEYLIAKGYDSTLKKNGQQGFDEFLKNRYDLCIFDVMMPVKDGFTLAKEIRRINTEIPIIFLTAKNLKQDTIEGLKIGADDYVTKPFSMEELVLRIQAILRRTRAEKTEKEKQTVYDIGKFTFDYNKQTLVIGSESQKLTSKENDLLRLLAININDVLDRNIALIKIWGDDSYFNSRSMDVYITKLRKYLKGDEQVEIVNIHGKGFKLMVLEN